MMHWVIDEILVERTSPHTGFPTLAYAALEAGHSIHRTKYVPIKQVLEPLPLVGYERDVLGVVYHGTFEGLRCFRNQTKGNLLWQPKDYCIKDNLRVSTYCFRYGNHMLNDEFILLPYGEVKKRGKAWFKKHYGDRFFIRPNEVTKVFAGRPILTDDFDHEINSLNKIESVPDDCLVVIAPHQNILSEARFVIADKEVVTGSTYQYGGKLDVRTDVFESQQKLAEFVAKSNWYPDTVYVVDIASISKTEAKIIEFNSFSCSGLYACDTRKIVNKVYDAVKKEISDV